MEKDYFQTALDYQKVYNLKKGKRNGEDDETDAFRHTFASAKETVKHNGAISDILGTLVEFIDPLFAGDNVTKLKKQTNMDMWNNAVGREIGEKIRSDIKENGKKYSEKELDDILADAVYQKIKNKEVITDIEDKRIYDVKTIQRVKAGFTQYIKGVQKDLKKIERRRKPSLNTGLAASVAEDKKLTGEHIRNQLAHQEQRKKDFAQRLFSKKEDNEKKFDENKLYSYTNEVTGDKKIFLAEMIEQMDEEEFAKNKKAIEYQKEKIGIPSEKEAKKAMSNGGMIHVKAYVRGDGTKVRDYYRSV